MPNATTLLNAIQRAYENLLLDSGGSQLALAFQEYNVAWAPIFNLNNQNERTVLDWLVPLTSLEALPATVGATVTDLANAVDVLSRMLRATIRAQTAGRISAPQGAAVLVAYNDFIARF